MNKFSIVCIVILAAVSITQAADFFYNDVTGKSQWEEPTEPVAYEDKEGRKYWYDSGKDAATWEFPGPWEEVHSEEHGQPYYVNKDKDHTTWEKPEVMGWKRVQQDEL